MFVFRNLLNRENVPNSDTVLDAAQGKFDRPRFADCDASQQNASEPGAKTPQPGEKLGKSMQKSFAHIHSIINAHDMQTMGI